MITVGRDGWSTRAARHVGSTATKECGLPNLKLAHGSERRVRVQTMVYGVRILRFHARNWGVSVDTLIQLALLLVHNRIVVVWRFVESPAVMSISHSEIWNIHVDSWVVHVSEASGVVVERIHSRGFTACSNLEASSTFSQEIHFR